MGILNITPDSFSDGGSFMKLEAALEQGLALFEAGADIVDVGGESTRPGSGERVDIEEELRRVVPVVRELRKKTSGWISVDTSRANVAEEALDVGADIINDVSAARFDRNMALLAGRRGVPLVMMHSRGSFTQIHERTEYGDLMSEVILDLKTSMRGAESAGVDRKQIILDPGIGFSKNADQSLEVIRRLDELVALDRPILVGPSRKSFIGKIIGRPANQRRWGTAGAVAVCVFGGAHIVRVHDVPEMYDVARVVDELRGDS
jgi:dihydropteroate synthase